MKNNQTLTDQPRIYVACLAAYNNGYLHGAWIDADQGAQAVDEALRVREFGAAGQRPFGNEGFEFAAI